MDRHPGAKKRYAPGDPPHMCDLEHAIREYAFETQTFVISVSQYISDDEMPAYSRDLNIATGGARVYLKEPVFDREEIIYAVLDA